MTSYMGYKIINDRGHVVITTETGDFFGTADTIGEAIHDINDELKE